MRNKKREARGLAVLRDPVWQGIGGILALLALVVSVWAIVVDNGASTELAKGQLEITNLGDYKRTDVADLPSRILVTLDGRPVEDLRRISAIITNTGSRPILSSHYDGTPTVTVHPPWEIVGYSAAAPYEPSSAIQVDWTIINSNTLAMTPSLLNPGDMTVLAIDVHRHGAFDDDQHPTLDWSMRIVAAEVLIDPLRAPTMQPDFVARFATPLMTLLLLGLMLLNGRLALADGLVTRRNTVPLLVGIMNMLIAVLIYMKASRWLGSYSWGYEDCASFVRLLWRELLPLEMIAVLTFSCNRIGTWLTSIWMAIHKTILSLFTSS